MALPRPLLGDAASESVLPPAPFWGHVGVPPRHEVEEHAHAVLARQDKENFVDGKLHGGN